MHIKEETFYFENNEVSTVYYIRQFIPSSQQSTNKLLELHIQATIQVILLDYIYLCDLWFKKPIYPTEIRASNIIPVNSRISLQFLIIENKPGT